MPSEEMESLQVRKKVIWPAIDLFIFLFVELQS